MKARQQVQRSTRRGLRRAVALIGAVAIAGMGLVTAGTTVQAAPLTATITDQKVTKGFDPDGTGEVITATTEITTSTTLTFHADWAVPGQSNNGDTFEVPVPTSFQIASSEPFNLVSDGTTVASCKYTTPDTAIVCTIVGGPHSNAEGNIWFTGRLVASESGENPVWDIGGDPIVLPVPNTPPPGNYVPPFGNRKSAVSARIVNGKAEMRWGVYMWPGCEGEGIPAGTCVDEFNVSDQLTSTSPAMPHTLRADSFIVDRWERAQNPDGTWVSGPGVDTGVDGSHAQLAKYEDGVWTVYPSALQGEVISEPVVSADGKSFTFNLDEAKVPYQYRILYYSDADGAVSMDGAVYQNTATINGEEKKSEAIPRVQGGGGANAEAYTSFEASKNVENATSATLPDSYTLTATQGSQSENITLPADGSSVNSPYFPANGGDITLCEVLPATDGVVWAPYTITGTGVSGPNNDGCYTLSPAAGQRISIEVNNRATPADGTFSVSKTLDADSYVTGLIGSADFTVEYTVDGQAQTPLVVKAGETVTSPSFPSGAQVQLTEAKPILFGVVWGTEVFSRTSFAIEPGKKIDVTLTNPATAAKVSVGDYTWIDTNRDGIQDADEPALPDVEVTLVGPNGESVTDVFGTVVGPQLTDPNGKYLFENLPVLQSGSYTVRVTKVPSGYFTTPQIEAGDDRAVDSSKDEASSHLPLDTDGAEDLTLDFGFVTYEPAIDIVKQDVNGNDANTETDAADLTDSDGKTTLEFIITNTGNEPLTNIKLTDVNSGSGTVENVSCAFPDGKEGTTWDGTLEPNKQVTCTATLSGVKPGESHKDEATVTATGIFTGQDVSDDDPYHAKVVKSPEPPVVDDNTGDNPDDGDKPGKDNKPNGDEKPGDSDQRGTTGLPLTGSNVTSLVIWSTALLFTGVALLLVRQRRNAVSNRRH